MRRSIAIVDHVGAKAGMDHYSGLLSGSLATQGTGVYLFSNFIAPQAGVISYRYFTGHQRSAVAKGINHIAGFLRSAVKCRLLGCRVAIVHVFSYGPKDAYALGILKLMGIKIVAIVHDIESFSQGRDGWGRLMLHSLADRILVHNAHSLKQLLELRGQGLRRKATIIPHGNFHALPQAGTDKAGARQQLGLRKDITYLLFFGQIKEVKGLDLLLKAMADLPGHIHLIVAGKPWKTGFGQYDRLIAELGISERVVKMIRFIADSERAQLFAACDMLVLPYKQIFQSGVLLMAMSYKIPVIASDLEPNKEVIEAGKTGLLFRNGDAEDLCRQIVFAAAHAHDLQEMSENAWDLLDRRHNWDDIAASVLDIASELEHH